MPAASSVPAEVIFSTPATKTTSAAPEAIASTPCRIARPPEAHAPSTRVQGTEPSPAARAIIGARWFCPVKA